MACDDIRDALSGFDMCVETQDGSRVTTHCLYPSFEPVNIFVSKFGDGYHVHDGGGAVRSAWTSGRDERVYEKIMERNALRYGVKFSARAFSVDVVARDWLLSAILSVANTSAFAANEVITHIATATEGALKERISAVLTEVTVASELARDYQVRGKSGKMHYFDFIIRRRDRTTLVDAVVPHHVSISAKYVAFADADGAEHWTKYAVYDRDLDVSDSALLQQVAALVPFSGLQPLMTRVPHNGR
jgi:hypothetical protein